MAALSLSGNSDAPLPELFHCQVVCLDHTTHFRLQFHPQFTNVLKRQCQLYSCLVTYESNANHWIHWSVQKFHSAVSILPTSFLPPKTKPSQQRRHRHIHRPVWRGIYLHCANSSDRVKDDAWVYSVYLHSANSFDRVNDDAQVSTFTMQMALTGSMMMPKSLPSQCKWLWQGQWWCPSLYLHNANGFDRVNDDAQVSTVTMQMALTGSMMMPKSTAHTFTVQTALTGSMVMPKHIPSQCKWLWQGQQWCPSLQCITSQYKQLWQGQWRCPSTYLHSANGFDRVNNDAQVYSA